MSLYAQYAALLDGVLDDLVAEGALPADLDRGQVTVDPTHGDLATNAAMVLAKPAQTNPRALAEAIKPKLEALPPVTSVEIAGPGFINLRLTPDAWRDELRTILAEADAYGSSTIGANERVNVLFQLDTPKGLVSDTFEPGTAIRVWLLRIAFCPVIITIGIAPSSA